MLIFRIFKLRAADFIIWNFGGRVVTYNWLLSVLQVVKLSLVLTCNKKKNMIKYEIGIIISSSQDN